MYNPIRLWKIWGEIGPSVATEIRSLGSQNGYSCSVEISKLIYFSDRYTLYTYYKRDSNPTESTRRKEVVKPGLNVYPLV